MSNLLVDLSANVFCPQIFFAHKSFLPTNLFCPRITRIFVQASAEPNLFELCRAQPKMSRNLHEFIALHYNGDLFDRTNHTNSMIELIELGVKCLEGTTERSDDNRGRSPRIGNMWPMCLEGTTPEEWYTGHVLWRTAFQAELSRLHLPRTSSPVIKKLRFCSAFLALNALLQPTRNHIIREIRGQNKP